MFIIPEKKTILVAIDHGYGNVKTPKDIFPTGITEYGEEPAIALNKLSWGGKWYAVGDSHKDGTRSAIPTRNLPPIRPLMKTI